MLTTSDGKFFLAAIDLYSRFCVGWAVGAVNDRHPTMRALKAAIRRWCPSAGLLHHSVQGSTLGFKGSSQLAVTYASEDYQALLPRTASSAA